MIRASRRRTDSGLTVAVRVLNEDEDDKQGYWHTNDGLQFWPTKQQAREEGLQKVLKRVKRRIVDAERALESERRYLKELEAAIGDSP